MYKKIVTLITWIGVIWFKTPKKYFVSILKPLIDSYSKAYLENIHSAKKS